ncbi:hypothetical protein V1523DRAFT_127832 [Lipomyces doorenjongii]
MPDNKAAWSVASKQQPLEVKPAPYTTPGENEIVIKTLAVAMNPIDWVKQEMGDIVFQWVTYPILPLSLLKPRMTWTNALYSYIANLANFQVLFYLPIYFQPSTASRLLRAASTPFRVRNRCLRGRSVFTTSVVGSSLGVYPRFRGRDLSEVFLRGSIYPALFTSLVRRLVDP